MDPLALDQPEDFSADPTRRSAEPADYSAERQMAADKLRLFSSERQDKSGLYSTDGQRSSDKLDIFPADRARGSTRHDLYSSESHLGQDRSRLYPQDRDNKSSSDVPDPFSAYIQSARDRVNQFSGYPGHIPTENQMDRGKSDEFLPFGQSSKERTDTYSSSYGGQRSSEKLEIFPSSDAQSGSKRSRNFGVDNLTPGERTADKLEIFATDNISDKSRTDRFSSPYNEGTRDKIEDYSLYGQTVAARDKAERFPSCAQAGKEKPENFTGSGDLENLAAFPSSSQKTEDDFLLDGNNRPKTENCASESPPRTLGKTEIFSSDENEPTESEKFEFYSSHGKKVKEKMENLVQDSHALKPQDIVLDYLKSRSKTSYCHRYDAVLWCEDGSIKIHRLVLAASSPMLASSMLEDSEDIESIFVEGASMRSLKEAAKFLYEGGQPGEDCNAILQQLGITASGLNKQWKGKSRSIEVKPDITSMDEDVSSLDREKYVKDEPDELDHHNDNLMDDDDDNDEEEMVPDAQDKSTLLGIQMYFSSSEAGYGYLQCTLCFMTVKNTEVSMLQHFSNHPDELDKINSQVAALDEDGEGGGEEGASTTKRSKVVGTKIWDYFDRLELNEAICTTCGKTMNTIDGSTTHIINHLKTKHPEEYQEFNKGRVKEPVKPAKAAKLPKPVKSLVEKKKKKLKLLKKQKQVYKTKEKRLHKKRSNIWIYFRKQTEEDCECKVCGKHITMSVNSRGSTTLLIQHLRCKHTHEYKVFQAMKGKSKISKETLQELDNEVKLKSLPKGSTLTLEDLNGDGIKKEAQEKIAKSRGSMAWLHFANVPGDPTSAVCNSCQVKVEGVTSVDVLLEHLRTTHADVYDVVYNPQDTKLSQKAVDMELTICEFCSETFPRAKMMLHIYATHFDEWAGNYKERFDVVKGTLDERVERGPFYKYLTAHYVFDDPTTNGGDCKICFVFVQKDINSLESHLKFFHPEIDTSERMPQAYWIMAANHGNEIGCNICGDAFRKEILFEEHMRDKHKCEHPDIMDWNDVLSNQLTSNDNFKCAVLLEKYDKTNNYWEEGKLPTHGEYARLDDPIFRTCIECKKVFASSSSMRYHQRVVHSGEKPYKCNMCEKVFNRNDTLQTHIASHSDLKPFMCSVCGKQFGRRHVRDTHERRHRGERRYPCHLCVKKFASSQQLKNHIRVHTGEKPFSCEHCGRMFAVKHQLVTHLRVHTGEKPYDCSKCTQKFKHLSTRRNHKCFGGGGVGAPERKQEPGSSSEHGGENPNVSPQHNVLRDPRDIRDQLFRLPLNQAYPMGL